YGCGRTKLRLGGDVSAFISAVAAFFRIGRLSYGLGNLAKVYCLPILNGYVQAGFAFSFFVPKLNP
ncbi:MAG: hypothetical protein ABJN84_01665, partial [Flavobacteriaceae bacterium]